LPIARAGLPAFGVGGAGLADFAGFFAAGLPDLPFRFVATAGP
jgi:hypothetical protein